ncbi:response regulator transcription factor [Clostridium botulinum]|uniref:Stage 0 sporulation protein A homolog n=1 Tax=Clostridium botulinum TaxID=1491 RepID=A0A6B4JNN8_CLOBO|nr:response regulator transcription factor [Clostridium botulinum]EES48972.1 regulatory protein VanR [Clostridium botulinum E1 str. 'BoNT E Beluga']MBY6761720.1 response regulator transcription factor [Clostridium botulinum]MBY6920707.1 response regulator transcription factor [Clostridium botulinum]MCR1131544.1 response regulator transcription factor [Clostridium botulinum]NFJ58552.1 response regulator transcription factor [Clostridium botulinum]
MNNKILIVDDEIEILKLLETVLKKEGFNSVYTAKTLKEGLAEFNRVKPELVILDIMLPDGDGYEICKDIRSKSNVPILFLSAKTEELDKILGFAIGGDDYITKPFSPKEVAFRVKAHLRRVNYNNENLNENNTEEKIIKFGPYVLNESRAELIKNGKIIELTAKELKILSLLAHNQNQIISKEKLWDKVWGEDYFGFDNTIMVHIRKLREKIEDDSSNPQYILTVRGLGYKLSVKED